MQALSNYDNNEYEESLRVFDGIADTSKILFNCGVIHATIGEHERAVRTGIIAERDSGLTGNRLNAIRALSDSTSILPSHTSSKVCRTS